jgi:dCTP deaminase
VSILSDREIKALCTKPKFVVYAGDKDKPIVQNFFIHDNVKEFVDMQNQQMFGTSSYLEARSKFPESIINERWIGYRDVQDSDLINWKPLITPFTEQSVKELKGMTIPSYGLGSYSYDVRIDRNFKIFKQGLKNGVSSGDDGILKPILPVIDTGKKNPTDGLMHDVFDVDYIDIQPQTFVLGNTVEKINVPRDILVTCMAKSSLARIGLDASVTPLEPGWEGYVTIELYNKTPYVIRLHSGVGIMALIFQKGNMPCEVAYNERAGGGKYQDQPALPVETVN